MSTNSGDVLRKKLLAKVHVLKSKHPLYAWNDEAWRESLSRRFSVESSGKLEIDSLVDLSQMLEAQLGIEPVSSAKSSRSAIIGNLHKSPSFASKRQLWAIKNGWSKVGRDPSDKALNAFIKRITGKFYESLSWMTRRDAQKVITALKKMEEYEEARV